jgi:hypothetical protein
VSGYDPVTPERLRTLLDRLGQAYRHPGRIYLVGGTSLLYYGLKFEGFLADAEAVQSHDLANTGD